MSYLSNKVFLPSENYRNFTRLLQLPQYSNLREQTPWSLQGFSKATRTKIPLVWNASQVACNMKCFLIEKKGMCGWEENTQTTFVYSSQCWAGRQKKKEGKKNHPLKVDSYTEYRRHDTKFIWEKAPQENLVAAGKFIICWAEQLSGAIFDK